MAGTWKFHPAARDLHRCRQAMLAPAALSLPELSHSAQC